MLANLSIRNLVLIESLDLDLQAGLNVFTGVTGAGKSILLDGLALATGGRGEAGLVRHGTDCLTVGATFAVPPDHPAAAPLKEQGIDVSDGLILRRQVGRDGRSKAWINDIPVGLALLKETGERLCEIHGQFASHALLNPARHAELLDAYGGSSELAGKVERAYRAWTAAENALAEQRRALDSAAEDAAYLEHSLKALQKLSPRKGEEDELVAVKKLMSNAQRLSELLGEASEIVDNRMLAESSRMVRLLDKANALLDGTLDGAVDTLDAALAGLNEVSEAVARTLDQLKYDPERLQENDDRLYALREQARKHRVAVDDLPEVIDRLSERLSGIEDGGGLAARLEREAKEKRAAFADLAKRLSEKRVKTAEKLDKGVNGELPPLKLEKARFVTDLTPLPEDSWGAGGAEKVTFAASTNPGQPPGALNKIASGGELARFMLAIKANFLGANPVPVMVFDEVDTGIGGATASAVGRRLLLLGREVQVLVITHSPQVAAAGQAHYLVDKSRDVTEVKPLDPAARQEEIARMLSGARITDEARAAALKLLAG